MNGFERLLPTVLSGVVLVVIALRAMFRAQRADQAHKLDWERWMADLQRRRDERLAAQAEANQRITIHALIKPGVAPEAVRDGLIELYRAMNEHHTASGAGVLTLEDFRRFVRSEIAVGV